MKLTKIFSRITMTLLICLAAFIATAPAGAANKCKDHCNERYKYRKDACKAIPLKHERHRCEQDAKRAKDECRRRCG